MRKDYWYYRENFPYILDVQHKVTPYTEKETFHLHNQMEIIYCLSDNLIFKSENSTFNVPAHSLLLINSMTLHHMVYMNDGLDCNRYVMHFTPEIILRLNTPEINLLDCFQRKALDGLLIPIPEGSRQRIKEIFDSLTDMTKDINDNPEYVENEILRKIILLSMTMELGKLLLQINRDLYLERRHSTEPQSSVSKEHSHIVAETCAYIDQHFQESLSVETVAQEFCVSKTQMYNLFREVLRMSVSDYLLHVRMSQAKSLLINTDYSIEIISQKVGYGNISSFSRTFKSQVSMTPLQYRKIHRDAFSA